MMQTATQFNKAGDSSTFENAFNEADNHELDDDTFVNHILDRQYFKR